MTENDTNGHQVTGVSHDLVTVLLNQHYRETDSQGHHAVIAVAQGGMKHYVYAIRETGHASDDAPVKIGVATSPWKRLYALQSGNPRELVLILYMGPFNAEEARAIERELHENFKLYREAGEWFRRRMRNDRRLKCMSRLFLNSLLNSES